MTHLYRADTTLLTVVRVECPDGTEYPADDADGKTIYDNTHFPTEAEAWKRLMSESEAGVSLAGSRVQDARKRLLDANQYAADQAAEYATVRDRYRDWQRAQDAADQAAEYATVRDHYRDWQRAQEQASEPVDEECDE